MCAREARFLSQPGVPSQGVRALHFPQPAPRRDERRWEDAMIPTTVAGSLPKPAWLAEPEKLWAPWRLEGAELVEGQQKAARSEERRVGEEWVSTVRSRWGPAP